MLYFDHSATTPPHDSVVQTIAEIMGKYYGNPSSLHRIGGEAEKLLVKARQVIADSLNTTADALIFTSGGTESNNLAIKGIAFQYQNRGKHIITTQIEHASVYETCKQLEQQGFELTYLPVDASGTVSVETLEQHIRTDTILVSIMYVNNEVGTIQPIEQIAERLKKYPKLFFHVDAVQALGKLPLQLDGSGIDLLSISAHKIQGPKGAGLLYCRPSITLSPLFAGGSQENGRRAGTENVPLIVGMAKAVRIAVDAQEEAMRHLYHLRAAFVKALAEVPGVQVNGAEDHAQMAPHIVHFSVPSVKSEVLLHALEQHHIYVSSRSACASSENKPSRVLLAMGLGRDAAISGIRVSYAHSHQLEDVRYFIERLRLVLKQIGI